jgi:predicted GTPase
MRELDAAYTELRAICQALHDDVMDAHAVRADVEAAAELLQHVPSLQVVVCGEYGRGKSTLLSALARRRLFPHMPDDTTSVATTLVWGATETAVVTYAAKDGSVADKKIDISDVQRFVTEVGNRSITESVIGVEIRTPLESIAWGLQLTDTPGLNSRNPAHNLITQQCLGRADVILFLASTDGPLSDLELDDFEKVAMLGAAIIPVLTKTDARDPGVLIRSANERLSTRLGRPVEVLPVSAVMALDGQEDRDIALEGASGVPALYRRLTALGAAHRARYALPRPDTGVQDDARPPVALLASALTALRTSATSELATIRHAEQERQAFADAVEDAQRKLDSLEEAARQFHLEVGDQVTQAIADIQQRVTDSCEKLVMQTKVDLAGLSLAMARQEIRPAAYRDGLIQSLGEIANWADIALERFLRGVVEEARRLTESELSYSPAPPSGPLLTAGDLTTPARHGRISFDTLRRGISSASSTAIYAGTVGGVFGGLVGSVPGLAIGTAVGVLIGQIAGAVAGTREAIRQDEQAQEATDIRQIALTASPWIEDAANRINARLAEVAPTEIDRLARTVDVLIAQRRGQLGNQREQAETNDAADRTERAARSTELAAQLTALDRLDTALARACGQLQILADA